MKKCAVFLVCDENLVFAMANMVLQLSKYDFIDSTIQIRPLFYQFILISITNLLILLIQKMIQLSK